MPDNYKTPSVYIEEIRNSTPPVIQVETAIPVFIGYTQKADQNSPLDLLHVPFLIHSHAEYVEHFGLAPTQELDIILNPSKLPVSAVLFNQQKFLTYYGVKSYFDHGGTSCYICSAGMYPESPPSDTNAYDTSLEAVSKTDGITILVFPDLFVLRKENFYAIIQQALIQCARLRDRFLIVDVYPETINNNSDVLASAEGLSTGIGNAGLSFGAAYFPFLLTAHAYQYDLSSLHFKQPGGKLDGISGRNMKGLILSTRIFSVLNKKLTGVTRRNKTARLQAINETWNALTALIADPDLKRKAAAWLKKCTEAVTAADFVITDELKQELMENAEEIKNAFHEAIQQEASHKTTRLISLSRNISLCKSANTLKFSQQIKAIASTLLVALPASPVVAGAYALTDLTRGVWKSPSNIEVQGEPVVEVNEGLQESLNVRPDGKSINAIRKFPGAGVKIWGARTLDGNNNEWRYVAVRRFFIMVETSIIKALSPFSFEPNDQNTWTTVRSVVDNFLFLQWKNGALAGNKPELAYYVRTGLNQTMTQADITEGRLIVEIGMAAIKPAEFIIIRITQIMSAYS